MPYLSSRILFAVVAAVWLGVLPTAAKEFYVGERVVKNAMQLVPHCRCLSSFVACTSISRFTSFGPNIHAFYHWRHFNPEQFEIPSSAPSLAFDTPVSKNLATAGETNQDLLTKQLEMDLAPLTSDMWGTQKWLEERGFRVERGNKSHSSWWLAARNRNTGQRIKVESDGTKLVVTPDG